jgi:hypothetical protein
MERWNNMGKMLRNGMTKENLFLKTILPIFQSSIIPELSFGGLE